VNSFYTVAVTKQAWQFGKVVGVKVPYSKGVRFDSNGNIIGVL